MALKVAVTILSYNRKEFLKLTLESIKQTEYPFELIVCDNGSTDGTAEYVESIGGVLNTSGNTTVGHGMNFAIREALKTDPDIVVFSADDYEYKEGWLEQLVQFWENADDDIAITSLNLERDFDWNTILDVIEVGGVRALVRTSLGGAQWSFRAEDWIKIGPVAEKTRKEDLEICERLLDEGYRLCQVDLSYHAGELYSAWGNESHLLGEELDRDALGFEEDEYEFDIDKLISGEIIA